MPEGISRADGRADNIFELIGEGLTVGERGCNGQTVALRQGEHAGGGAQDDDSNVEECLAVVYCYLHSL